METSYQIFLSWASFVVKIDLFMCQNVLVLIFFSVLATIMADSPMWKLKYW